MKWKRLLIPVIILCCSNTAESQSPLTLDGYLNDMQTVYHLEEQGWLWENQLHNRLNLNLYPAGWLQVSLQGRTRLLQGKTFSGFPGYASMFGKDPGWIDLTAVTSHSYNNDLGVILTSTLDRAYAAFSAENFTATIGRQRINWGQTFVWNPNDIFNAYSFFDVDYPERPGSDAVRLQYYTGMTSVIEIAAKVDSASKVTAAGYFRMNAFGYDFQFLGGTLAEEDLVLGTGWSGSVAGTSFRGELTYFHDLEHFSDTTGHLLLSAGLDHTFGNALWLQSEVLYSGLADSKNIYSFMQLFNTGMNVKNTGFTKWSVFGSLSYPATPLLNLSLSGIWYPEWKGIYLGPSTDLSLTDNLKATIILQGFSAELKHPTGTSSRQNTFVGYARLKWNF
ncbi:MAG: hypothetical protein K9G38_04155 [Bacteroidales bacterium]|nr:hypothetical protein [Bacteroidales bacterium]